MADPQDGYPVIHVAGTNGKTSTVRICAALADAHGLTAGTFVSPHLERIEERFGLGGVAMTPEGFAAAVSEMAPFVGLFEARSDAGPTYFELTAALAFSWFAERAADLAVVEVGLGGRLDATNVVDAEVAVVTGIGLDHTEYLGTGLGQIAAEKAAILHEGRTLVTGPLPPAAEGAMVARVQQVGGRWLRYEADFRPAGVARAVGGWLCDIEGVHATYEEVFLPLHGRHQVANLVVAAAACEALLGRALDPDAVRAGAAAARSPGRLEVVGAEPLVVLDGAHNRQGMEALAAALAEEFLPERWVVVFGARGPRDPADLIEPLLGRAALVIVTRPDDPSAIPTGTIAAGVRAAFGEDFPVEETSAVPEAIARALLAADGAGVVVCGSLYVVGEARAILAGDGRTTSRIASEEERWR